MAEDGPLVRTVADVTSARSRTIGSPGVLRGLCGACMSALTDLGGGVTGPGSIDSCGAH